MPSGGQLEYLQNHPTILHFQVVLKERASGEFDKDYKSYLPPLVAFLVATRHHGRLLAVISVITYEEESFKVVELG